MLPSDFICLNPALLFSDRSFCLFPSVLCLILIMTSNVTGIDGCLLIPIG